MTHTDEPTERPSLLERLSAFLTREPEDREELLALLHGAYERKLLDADALSMIEGVRGIAFSRFTSADVVRHPLVQKIINAYEKDTAAKKRAGESDR